MSFIFIFKTSPQCLLLWRRTLFCTEGKNQHHFRYTCCLLWRLPKRSDSQSIVNNSAFSFPASISHSLSNKKSLVCAGVCRWRSVCIQNEEGGRDVGSSPELAEGSALVFVVGSWVGLPAFPLRRLVVDVGRWTREVVWILLHHLELGLDGADLSARARGGWERRY